MCVFGMVWSIASLIILPFKQDLPPIVVCIYTFLHQHLMLNSFSSGNHSNIGTNCTIDYSSQFICIGSGYSSPIIFSQST